MTQKMPDELEAFRDLTEGLIEVLQSWPLYRRFEYADHDRHFLDAEGETFGVLPQEITLPCKTCKSEPRWRRTGGGVGGEGRIYLNAEPHGAIYKCRNCDRREISFTFYWYLTKEGGLFQKVGQYPPLHYFHGVPHEIMDTLSDSDLKLYRQALSNRNANFGIGAVSYLRRVVGHTLDDILELEEEVARNTGGSGEDRGGLEEVRNSKGVDQKIELVSKTLSVPMKPGGHDPLGCLHDLFNDARYSKNDEESVDVFDKSKLVFEYLVRALSKATGEAKSH